MSRSLWFLAVLVGGVCLATQSRVNGELSARIGDGLTAALISFTTGTVLLVALTIVTPFGRAGAKRLVRAVRDGRLRWWYLSTGLVGAWFVSAQGLAVPDLGVALFTVCVVAGQSVSGMVVDRVGIGVLPAKSVTVPRVLGALVTVGAVSLGLLSTGVSPAVLLMVLAFVSGMLMSVQQAFGGQVQHHSGSVLAQATQNFVFGTIALAAIVGVRAIGGAVAGPLPAEWWLYLGGPLGCVFVAVSAIAVHRIGVLMLTLTAVAGQVLGSLVLDIVVPTGGHPLTVWSFAGAALAIVGVAISALVRPRSTGGSAR